MLKRTFTMAAAVCAACSAGFASQLTVSIKGFGDPSAFSMTGQDLDLRVRELVPAQGDNTSTHIFIEGLSPIEAGTLHYASTYSGINAATGQIQDSGVLYLTMPPGSELPAGTVASPIVGVVQRPGDWADAGYSLVFPATDLPGNPSGPADFDGNTLSMSLADGGYTFLGTTGYTVIDQDTLVLAPFTLTRDGLTSFKMSEATLLRDGNRFYGALTNLSDSAGYDSLIFSIELYSIPDVDGDGVPDITDSGIMPALDVGQWNLTELRHLWAATGSIVYSPFLGWISVAEYPLVYHFELGWIFVVAVPVAPDTGYWMWSPSIGWIFTSSSWGGLFLQEAGGWSQNDFLNPNP